MLRLLFYSFILLSFTPDPAFPIDCPLAKLVGEFATPKVPLTLSSIEAEIYRLENGGLKLDDQKQNEHLANLRALAGVQYALLAKDLPKDANSNGMRAYYLGMASSYYERVGSFARARELEREKNALLGVPHPLSIARIQPEDDRHVSVGRAREQDANNLFNVDRIESWKERTDLEIMENIRTYFTNHPQLLWQKLEPLDSEVTKLKKEIELSKYKRLSMIRQALLDAKWAYLSAAARSGDAAEKALLHSKAEKLQELIESTR